MLEVLEQRARGWSEIHSFKKIVSDFGSYTTERLPHYDPLDDVPIQIKHIGSAPHAGEATTTHIDNTTQTEGPNPQDVSAQLASIESRITSFINANEPLAEEVMALRALAASQQEALATLTARLDSYETYYEDYSHGDDDWNETNDVGDYDDHDNNAYINTPDGAESICEDYAQDWTAAVATTEPSGTTPRAGGPARLENYVMSSSEINSNKHDLESSALALRHEGQYSLEAADLSVSLPHRGTNGGDPLPPRGPPTSDLMGDHTGGVPVETQGKGTICAAGSTVPQSLDEHR